MLVGLLEKGRVIGNVKAPRTIWRSPGRTRRIDLSIEPKNFGPIISGEVRVKPLTVLIGPNNSGKSYAAMLIRSMLASHGPTIREHYRFHRVLSRSYACGLRELVRLGQSKFEVVINTSGRRMHLDTYHKRKLRIIEQPGSSIRARISRVDRPRRAIIIDYSQDPVLLEMPAVAEEEVRYMMLRLAEEIIALCYGEVSQGLSTDHATIYLQRGPAYCRLTRH